MRLQPDLGHKHSLISIVLLQALKEDPPVDFKCRDKFLVQSAPVDSDQSDLGNFWQSLEKTSKGTSSVLLPRPLSVWHRSKNSHLHTHRQHRSSALRLPHPPPVSSLSDRVHSITPKIQQAELQRPLESLVLLRLSPTQCRQIQKSSSSS